MQGRALMNFLPRSYFFVVIFTSLIFGVCLPAQPAQAFFGEIWDYVKQYQVGVDYKSSFDSVRVDYEVSSDGGITDNCEALVNDPSHKRCHTDVQAGQSSGWGLFLQQAFRRQGFFYFKPDIGFGARYLHGTMQADAKREQSAQGLPLRNMSFSLLAVLIKPYIQVGITPDGRWPDILLSLGPAAQIGLGKVSVNDESSNVAVATSSGKSLIGGFTELELVFLRFGDGLFSAFVSRDFTSAKEGSRFYPRGVDGMDDFRATFSREVGGGLPYGFGAKLVLNWP